MIPDTNSLKVSLRKVIFALRNKTTLAPNLGLMVFRYKYISFISQVVNPTTQYHTYVIRIGIQKLSGEFGTLNNAIISVFIPGIISYKYRISGIIWIVRIIAFFIRKQIYPRPGKGKRISIT